MCRRSSPAARRAVLLPAGAVVVNQLVYYGGNWIARGKPHLCLEMPADRFVPFLPWTVAIYLGCFLFWAAVYLYMARQEETRAYRFFCADLLAKLVCFGFFVCLPTTNIRPALGDDGLWETLLAFVYRVDAPTNLFPSIHCMVSWLCWIGLRDDRRIPRWGRAAACAAALAVCWSTLTTRQHVIADVFAGVLLAEGSWRLTGYLYAAFQAHTIAKTMKE